ncbi:ArsR/SmtB family transcription factor [Cytobacillus purgationiresistens]|uniref:DNA-binding transcriptional ArsR family regulator n=1 Tax=Cytobacillus purgationiresistens TaxID=863449 RepID=A0ABU0AH87_9BACI|nr:metalloregulator ArsR/SmtB family transcription factor [Cytobacillus purgationiresistens]MDQ0270602.1 DNA-binding transcriptional ArsR family regulator [Cytobacillus purgationiresistens]
MSLNPNISEVVSLLGETSRATILSSLMDGRFHTASELALMAAIKPQTASFHLAKLVGGNLVKVEKHGRYRYYQLANKEVAELVESLLGASPAPKVHSLRESSQLKLLQEARTCYDHLAGRLGVRITEAMLHAGYLEKGEKEFVVTDIGEQFFSEFGLNLDEVRRNRRSFARACLDWSERHHHLAGALGTSLMNRFIELGWIAQMPTTRAVKVTARGTAGFKEYFHIEI